MSRRWLDPSYFTDEKIKKATRDERLLGLALIANQDDDGRLRGDPASLRDIAFKWDNFSLGRIKAMRDHLSQVNPNIIVYKNGEDEYIQLRYHGRYQNPRYYHPSKIPPPPGWPFSDEQSPPSHPGSNRPVTTTATEITAGQSPPSHPDSNRTDALGKGEGEGKGKGLDLDLDLGEGEGLKQHPPPSPGDLCTDLHLILDKLLEYFKYCFGRAARGENGEVLVTPREPSPRERAQIRDLAAELVKAGGCPLSYIGAAFKEAGLQPEQSKRSVSYVRAILLDWLGVVREKHGQRDKQI